MFVVRQSRSVFFFRRNGGEIKLYLTYLVWPPTRYFTVVVRCWFLCLLFHIEMRKNS